MKIMVFYFNINYFQQTWNHQSTRKPMLSFDEVRLRKLGKKSCEYTLKQNKISQNINYKL